MTDDTLLYVQPSPPVYYDQPVPPTPPHKNPRHAPGRDVAEEFVQTSVALCVSDPRSASDRLSVGSLNGRKREKCPGLSPGGAEGDSSALGCRGSCWGSVRPTARFFCPVRASASAEPRTPPERFVCLGLSSAGGFACMCSAPYGRKKRPRTSGIIFPTRVAQSGPDRRESTEGSVHGSRMVSVEMEESEPTQALTLAETRTDTSLCPG